MKLYAPEYYKKFKCIADRCEHSCCIGWEIDIDETTYRKYQKFEKGYGIDIKNSISLEGGAHFKLCENEKCPHLDEKGLCKIILNVGEDHLCNICREHPRFYNYTAVAEVGLGMSCREAAELILSSQNYDVFEEIGEVDAVEDEVGFDGRAERAKIYRILKSESDYKTKLERIYREYGLDSGDDSEWLEIIGSLEYLDASHRDLFLTYSSKNRPEGKNDYLERALAYFIYRHCTEAFDEEDFACRLSFCLFCERLLASLIASQNSASLADIAVLASIISEEIEYSEDNTEALMY
ncbi:MAG: flagellin lysine-N-methylase [Clostridia bacterium]|nr:flagellin lysine-N-methylase [Clostridia bacterium]